VTRPTGDYILVCDKPAGVTSHDVVAAIRRELPRRTKVGHAGTLDPFATGLLLVLVGRATRAQRFLMALEKRYETVARFGAVSSTGDPEGEISETGRVPDGPLVLPTGTVRQRPPAYSAVKVDGRRAYERARAGEEVVLAEREVTVSRFEECSRSADGTRRSFVIECSSGTYVRSLIADLGDAYCEALRRTAVGPFEVSARGPSRSRRRTVDRSRPAAGSWRGDRHLGARGRRLGADQRPRRTRRDRRGARRRRAHRAVGPGRDRRAARLTLDDAPRGSLSAMRVIELSDATPRPRRVAVGEFDGVHLGHREVIAGADTVLTFEPHPLRVLAPERAPRLITSLAVKADLVQSLGVEELVVIRFDEMFALQSPQAFCDEILAGALGATHVSVGENFRFGHDAAGDTAMLVADPRFETRIVRLVEVEGEIVSSSHIRALVAAGEVDHAARFLGAPFQMRGEIVHGDKRGRELGYPTANLVPDDSLVSPGHGVYAARADGAPAAVSIGVRPTFGMGLTLLVETYVIDAELELYGRQLHLEFLARLRGERRFDSAASLVEQMARDVADARAICG
jgi:riboflavin kinase/FMN adenylyltransferase